MTIVTGLTAARMLDIEAKSVVDGDVNGSGHLILTKHDGSTIDAGSVIGPTGATGPTGPLADAPNNTNHYVRKGGLWVPLEGTEMAALVKQVCTKTQTAINYLSQITSTTPATIATVNVPSVLVNSKLDVCAHWNVHNADPLTSYEFLIFVDGVQKAVDTLRFPSGSGNVITKFVITSIPWVTIAAGSGSTVLVKARNTNADSSPIAQDNPGMCTVETWPA